MNKEATKHAPAVWRRNHLRWDSLGEFLALAASLEHLANRADMPRAAVLAETLDKATGEFLDRGRSRSPKGARGRSSVVLTSTSLCS